MTRKELTALAEKWAETGFQDVNGDYWQNKDLQAEDCYIAGFLAGRDAAAKLLHKLQSHTVTPDDVLSDIEALGEDT